MITLSLGPTLTHAAVIPIITSNLSSALSVSLSSSQVDASTYVLTAQASQNIAAPMDYIDIADQTAGRDQPCYGVATCSEAVTVDLSNPVVLSDIFVAVIYDGSGNVLAASLPMTIGNGRPGPGGNFGILNINGYCQALGYYGALLAGPTALDWTCDNGLSTGPHLGQSNMNTGCQWQFERLDVVAEPATDGTMNWNCWQNTSSGTPPTAVLLLMTRP
jgi:hypothetical protein